MFKKFAIETCKYILIYIYKYSIEVVCWKKRITEIVILKCFLKRFKKFLVYLEDNVLVSVDHAFGNYNFSDTILISPFKEEIRILEKSLKGIFFYKKNEGLWEVLLRIN